MLPSTVLLARVATEEAVREPGPLDMSNRRMHRPYIVTHDKHSRSHKGQYNGSAGRLSRIRNRFCLANP
jgi:hypothetical protein